MRVMVLVKATEWSEKGLLSRRLDEGNDGGDGQVQRRNCAKPESWSWVRGLKPTADAKRVAFDGAGRTVIDGPFTKSPVAELVAGFWLWNVKDMDEAVAWVKRCPNPMAGPSDIEVRPLYEMSDLA